MPAAADLPGDIPTINGTRRIEAPARQHTRADRLVTPTLPDRADSVEISERSRVIALIREPLPLRESLVAAMRDQIAREDFLTDARIDGALNEIVRDFNELG